jgi:hypothetical protein
VNEDFAVLEANGGYFLMNFMLAKTRLGFLAFGTM